MAVVFALLWMGSGAALAGDTYPIDPPQVEGEEDTRPDDSRDDTADDTSADVGVPEVQRLTATRDGSLAFTGADVLRIVLVAAVLVGAGAALVAWRRRRVA